MIHLPAIPEYGLPEIKSPHVRRVQLVGRCAKIANHTFEADNSGTKSVLAYFDPWNQMIGQLNELMRILY